MKEMPVAAWVRSYVLNQLEKGPVRVADLFRAGATEFGFTAHEMRAAAEYFAVSTHIANGELYWTRPSNLSAIWWAKPPAPDSLSRCKHTA